MRKIAMILLGLTLIPSCQMEQTSNMKEAVSPHVVGGAEEFVQALKDEAFESAQSMLQAGKISVHEKVDISTVSELAEALSAHKVGVLLPFQVAAYWGDESLIKFIWEQAPSLYTKQDIDLALELAMSGENYDAIEFFEETISKNFPDEGIIHAHDADKEKVLVGGASSASHEEAVEEDNTGKMQKDEDDDTGKMQKDEDDDTGKMQKDKEDDDTGKMQKDREDDDTGKMQKDREDDDTGKMQKDTE